MTFFSLDPHIIKEEPQNPEWSQRNATTKEAYLKIIARSQKIESHLNQLSAKELKKIGLKARQIVVKQIAEDIGVHRTALTSSRMPELHAFVGRENSRLAHVFKHRCKLIGYGEKSTKDKLEDTLKQKNREIQALQQQNHEAYYYASIKSEVLDSQLTLALKIRELEELRRKDQEKIAVLQQRIDGLMKELNMTRTS